MARISVTRTMAADPTSTALLLGGPTALERWAQPGVTVRVQIPWRTPTAYVSRLAITGERLPDAAGLLTLAYDSAADGTVRTTAALRLDFASPSSGDAAVELRSLAEELLGTFADLAEERAFAA